MAFKLSYRSNLHKGGGNSISKNRCSLTSAFLVCTSLIFILVLVVEHVHVDLAHQAARTAVIQLAFATLSHVRSSPFALTFFLIPIVYMGEKENPSRKYPTPDSFVRMDNAELICGITASAE